MLQGTLGLDEILRREITTDWYEGVAVIQAVCRAVPGIGAPGAGFPTPRQISIKATGEIELLGVTSSPDAVVAAGRLLGEMLHNDVPVRLRLTHSEAVATRPAFATLPDLVNALAYFERPDGPQTIQKLYARASAARERPGQGDQPAGSQPAAPGQKGAPAELKQENPPRQRRRSNPWYAVAAGIVLVGVAATALVSSGGRQAAATFGAQAAAIFSGGTEPVEEATTPQIERAGKPGAKAATAGGRTTRKGEAVSSGSRTVDTPAPAQRPVSRSTSRRPAVLPALETRGPVPSPILLAGWSGAPVFHETIEVQVEEASEEAEAPVYSRLDGGVRPPIAIRPHLPSEPPAHVPVDHLMVLDLVVADDGVVESVRLLTDPRTVNDFMIVSAAKAWIFAPATLDGQPVKYRHRIRFAVP